MEIHITYETLFDLLRKERSLDELQPLDVQFWAQVVDYLNDRDNFLSKTSSLEKEKARLQLQNIKRILREIYDRREQKIVNLAVNVVRTEATPYVDKRNMLAEEKGLFDESLALLEKYKKGILFEVFDNRLPSIMPEVYASFPADLESGSEPLMNNFPDTDAPELTPEEDPSPVMSASPESIKTSDEENSSESTTVLVKFTTAVPRFVGKNKEVFGPFDEGNIVSLPAQIANILIKKGKVQAVLSS